MSAKRIHRSPARSKPSRGKVDLDYLRNLTDEEIERTAPPELPFFPDDFWKDAVLVHPEPKDAISLRVDRDVLEWFRDVGPGYQTRMNAVLRSYMEQTRASSPVPAKKRKPRSRKGA